MISFSVFGPEIGEWHQNRFFSSSDIKRCSNGSKISFWTNTDIILFQTQSILVADLVNVYCIIFLFYVCVYKHFFLRDTNWKFWVVDNIFVALYKQKKRASKSAPKWPRPNSLQKQAEGKKRSPIPPFLQKRNSYCAITKNNHARNFNLYKIQSKPVTKPQPSHCPKKLFRRNIATLHLVWSWILQCFSIYVAGGPK